MAWMSRARSGRVRALCPDVSLAVDVMLVRLVEGGRVIEPGWCGEKLGNRATAAWARLCLSSRHPSNLSINHFNQLIPQPSSQPVTTSPAHAHAHALAPPLPPSQPPSSSMASILRASLRAPLSSGAAGPSNAAFILPCRKLVLEYCEVWGSNKGMRDFVATEAVRLAEKYPGVEFVVRRVENRHPHLKGNYGKLNQLGSVSVADELTGFAFVPPPPPPPSRSPHQSTDRPR